MTGVTLQRPTKKEFRSNPHVYTDVEYDIHLRDVRQIEIVLNELVNLTEDTRTGRVHRDFEAHSRMVMNDVLYSYTRPEFGRLSGTDQEMFRRLIREFGVLEIIKRPLHHVVHELFRRDLTDSVPTDNLYVHRLESVMGQLGNWTAVQIFLKNARPDVFLATSTPQEFDPLALVAHTGFSLTLYPTETTCVIEKTNGLTISNVRIGLNGMYVCRYGQPDPYCLLNTDSDNVFSVTYLRDSFDKPFKAVRVRE